MPKHTTSSKPEKQRFQTEPFRQLYRSGKMRLLKLIASKELKLYDLYICNWLEVNVVKKDNSIPMSQQDIARELKVTPSTVCRSFKRLKKYRLIVTNQEGKDCLASTLTWGGKLTDRFWRFNTTNGKH